uniref:Uncharacterized protein n=1 Tax=Timema bartmani TaxID=61472 RepID=A0A7R9EQT5_9NEOP|nr:unnamed protein product [Timema bartmani]
MLILFLLFLVQFSVACACLAVNMEQQHELAEQGWKRVTLDMKGEVQKVFNCCGFEGSHNSSLSTTPDPMAHPPCIHPELRRHVLFLETREAMLECGQYHSSHPSNSPAHPYVFVYTYTCVLSQGRTSRVVVVTCAVLSDSVFVGVWLTVRYRNQKDPRANPSAFL